MSEKAQTGACVLTISGELTIFRAAELKEEVQRAIGDCPNLVVELSGVTEVDASGLQLLVSAQRTLMISGGALELKDPSEAVVEALRASGLTGWFGLKRAA